MANQRQTDELKGALGSARGLFTSVGLFSLFINILLLVSPLYMLQVYDRVLTSRSHDTLVALTVLAIGLIALSAFLELVRSRILVRLSARLDAHLSETVFSALFRQRLRSRGASGTQPLRDLEAIRTFLTGTGLLAFFDSPWTPIFLTIIFLFHPILGVIALTGAAILFTLAVISEFATRGPLRKSGAQSVLAYDFADSTLRNAEAIRAMGMLPQIRARWLARHMEGLASQSDGTDRAGLLTSIAKLIRPGLQVAMLGAGAYLVLQEAITPGVMIASSIIMGRALAPVEGAINNWRSFIAARSAHGRLRKLLEENPEADDTLELPAPKGQIRVESATVIPPGAEAPVLRGVSFEIKPGETVGVIGPSAAGKSTLARLLVGVWPPAVGHMRLDGADLCNWAPERLGPSIGYLPQDVELLAGTIAENIARFEEPDAQAVIEAAKLCDAHEMILSLKDGYDTQIGEQGGILSGGQRQRIGLARALYGNPAVIVLDEPNASLDGEGETALKVALQRLKERERTVVIISHKPQILASVDNVLVLRNGQLDMYGSRDEVLPQLMRPVRSVPSLQKIRKAKEHAGG